MSKGIFITLEGGEACGKSTLAENLKTRYAGENVVFVREPGGTVASEKIREVVLFTETELKTEVLLFAASRNELVSKVIKPSLEQGKIVICDRFIHSSLAYQGHARGFGMDRVLDLNGLDIEPDLTIYLKIDPVEAFKRKTFDENDSFERQKLRFHQRVAEGYDICAKKYKYFHTIDATKSIEAVLNEAIDAIEKTMKEKARKSLSPC